MSGDYLIWVIAAGVIGLIVGFGIGYMVMQRKSYSHRDELFSLRNTVEERQSRIEQAEAQAHSMNKRVEEKERQLETAKKEIHDLERTLEEKAEREKKAIHALREAFHEDVRTEQNRAQDNVAATEAQRQADIARQRREAEVLEDHPERIDEVKRR